MRSTSENPTERLSKRYIEIERCRRLGRKSIYAADIVAIDAPGRITRVGGIDVSISEHNCAGMQWRQDGTFEPVSEISGVYGGKRQRCEQTFGFAVTRRFTDYRRGVPFTEVGDVPLADQPFSQQVELGGFS